MRRIAMVAGFVVVLLVAAVIAWINSIDHVVAMAIEHYGSEVLGTAVSVESVELHTREGKGTVRGLRIAQPTGFGSGHAVAVEEILLDLDEGSLVSGDPYVVSLVAVEGPEVRLVMAKNGASNLQALQRNVAESEDEIEAAEESGGAPGPVTRIRIDRLEIAGGKIDADMTALGIGRAEAALPSMRMSGLGGHAGAPAEDIAAEVSAKFIAHTLTAVTRSTVGRRLDQLFDKGTKDVRDMLDSLFKQR